MSQDQIEIEWSGDGLIGRLKVGGEFWCAVEWSEKHQRWCVEDCEGQCLKHVASIRGMAESKEAAVAMAEAMVRDGRMPSPEQARAEHDERRRVAREKREQRPSEIRRRKEREEQNRRWADACTKEWQVRTEEEKVPPLYEALADAFDFADPELWKSNSFAALRPRLALHLRRVIAELEQELAYATGSRKTETSSIEAKLARARQILGQLVSSDRGAR